MGFIFREHKNTLRICFSRRFNYRLVIFAIVIKIKVCIFLRLTIISADQPQYIICTVIRNFIIDNTGICYGEPVASLRFSFYNIFGNVKTILQCGKFYRRNMVFIISCVFQLIIFFFYQLFCNL